MRCSSLRYLMLVALAVFLLFDRNGHSAPPVKIDIPATPDGTIIAFFTAISEGQFEVCWQALPASSQADFKKMLLRYATQIKIDDAGKASTTWIKLSDTLEKLSKILATKQDFIIASNAVNDRLLEKKITKAEAKAKLTIYSGLVDDIQKQIRTTEEIEKLDVEQFLANVGSRVKELNRISIKHGRPYLINYEDLKKITTVVKKSTPDSAVVECKCGEDGPFELEMIKIEGKWLPNNPSLFEFLVLLKGQMIRNEVNQEQERSFYTQYPPWVLRFFVLAYDPRFTQCLNTTNQREFKAVVSNNLEGWEDFVICLLRDGP